MSRPPIERISASVARRILLRLQALDGRRSGSGSSSGSGTVSRMVERLGYVQIDSINVLDRAHDRILATRIDGYRPGHLQHALERSRSLFEHWTHDASAIPMAWAPHWRHRFRRHEQVPRSGEWWRRRFGEDPQGTMRRVLRRIRREGPLRTRDLEPPPAHRAAGWWNWHPEKAAVEHLWRCGRLAIAGREGFEKRYDLVERVVPETLRRASTPRAHLDWACREAIDRLGIASASEIAAFFDAVPVAEVRRWAADAVRRGELDAVEVERLDGGRPLSALARPDRHRFADPIEHESILPLSPFDPVVRDRRRLARLFGFEYRFEAFIPAAKRRHGYYVLPLLDGERFVGRIDPRFDRDADTLVVRGPWWERGAPRDRRRLESALDRLAREIGAARWRIERPTRR